MSTVGMLPARLTRQDSSRLDRKAVNFKETGPAEKSLLTPETLHAQLKALLDAEFRKPLSSVVKQLDSIDGRVAQMDIKMAKCLRTVTDMALKEYTCGHRQQDRPRPHEPHVLESDRDADVPEPSRSFGRCNTLPAQGSKPFSANFSLSTLGVTAPRSLAQKNSRQGLRPLPLQVMPEFLHVLPKFLQPSPSLAPTHALEPSATDGTTKAGCSGSVLASASAPPVVDVSLGMPTRDASSSAPRTSSGGWELQPRDSPKEPPLHTPPSILVDLGRRERRSHGYLKQDSLGIMRRVSTFSSNGSRCNPANSSSSRCTPFSSNGSRARFLRDRRPGMESMSSCTSLHCLAPRNRLPKPRDRQGKWASGIWRFLEDPESSCAAHYYASMSSPFIMLSVFLTCIQTFEPSPIDPLIGAILESAVEVLFIIEVAMRFFVCPNRKVFFSSPYNVIDMMSTLPLLMRGAVGFVLPSDQGKGSLLHQGVSYVLFCLVPVVRLLKVLRHFETFQLLLSAFNQVLEALPVLLYTQLLLTLVFSSLIFLVEPRDNIASLPAAAWLTIVTMTTVGYGDVTPASPAGSCVVGILVISSVIFMAFPLGIIGSTFTAVWSDRDRILLMQRTRDCLDQWGYTAQDIAKLFNLADQDGDDELNLEEFRDLMDHMRLGLKDERVVELFLSFDYDFSGSINHEEFIRVLFPGAHLVQFATEQGVVNEKTEDEDPMVMNLSLLSSPIDEHPDEEVRTPSKESSNGVQEKNNASSSSSSQPGGMQEQSQMDAKKVLDLIHSQGSDLDDDDEEDDDSEAVIPGTVLRRDSGQRLEEKRDG